MHNNRVMSIFEVFELATLAQNDQPRKQMGFRRLVRSSYISLMYYGISPSRELSVWVSFDASYLGLLRL
jgi:hypothetical protein